MLILTRSVGQSVVIGETHTVTLSRVDAEVVEVTLTHASDQAKGRSIAVSRDESVEVLPGVRLAFVGPHPDRPGVRLGISAPREMRVYRKEVFDSMRRTPGTDKKDGC